MYIVYWILEELKYLEAFQSTLSTYSPQYERSRFILYHVLIVSDNLSHNACENIRYTTEYNDGVRWLCCIQSHRRFNSFHTECGACSLQSQKRTFYENRTVVFSHFFCINRTFFPHLCRLNLLNSSIILVFPMMRDKLVKCEKWRKID